MSETFKEAKVGDKVWHSAFGWGSITEKDIFSSNKFRTDFEFYAGWFSLDGKGNSDKYQTLFWDEVKIIPPPRPKRKVKKVIEAVDWSRAGIVYPRDCKTNFQWNDLLDKGPMTMTLEWEE